MKESTKKMFVDEGSPLLLTTASMLRQATDTSDLKAIVGTLEYITDSLKRIIDEESQK